MPDQLIIDAYTHFACTPFIEFIEAECGRDMVFKGLFSRIPELTDVDKRLKLMDEYGVDVNCLVPLPWLECEPTLHADELLAIKVHSEYFELALFSLSKSNEILFFLHTIFSEMSSHLIFLTRSCTNKCIHSLFVLLQ